MTREGITVSQFFSDSTFGGNAGALSEAIFYRDAVLRELPPDSRSERARRKTARNRSGIVGVRRHLKPVKNPDGRISAYYVWTATGSPQPGQPKTRSFYVGKLGEDGAREAAIAQRLLWEKEMERHEKRRTIRKAS